MVQDIKHRAKYTEDDIIEGIRLVKEEEFSVKTAAGHVNDVRLNIVPRMTLADRLRRANPSEKPTLGRPIELADEVEEALVKCLEWCAEFNFPMRKRGLQDLVQNYCVENNVKVGQRSPWHRLGGQLPAAVATPGQGEEADKYQAQPGEGQPC